MGGQEQYDGQDEEEDVEEGLDSLWDLEEEEKTELFVDRDFYGLLEEEETFYDGRDPARYLNGVAAQQYTSGE